MEVLSLIRMFWSNRLASLLLIFLQQMLERRNHISSLKKPNGAAIGAAFMVAFIVCLLSIRERLVYEFHDGF
jgi:hypothetical protein